MSTLKRSQRPDTPLETYDPFLVAKIQKHTGQDERSIQRLISAAVAGRETSNNSAAIEKWIETQFLPNTILIDEAGYTEMCIDALKTISTQTLTDFGSSRQRDFGQAWSDTIRGYLGEFAVTKFLEKRFGIKTKLAHQRGIASTFYDSDISEVFDSGSWRKTKTFIGIKTAKFNGVWLDVPKEQFAKSHVHVQVKIGVDSTHLFSFFKKLSVFKDKILKVGIEGNYLSEKESEQIWNDIPEFTYVPAYISGFAIRDFSYSELDYEGYKAKKHYTIHAYRGFLPANYEEEISRKESLPIGGRVKLLAIGELTSADKYLFNTGSILRNEEEWEKVATSL
jgi:hypothetical protein